MEPSGHAEVEKSCSSVRTMFCKDEKDVCSPLEERVRFA